MTQTALNNGANMQPLPKREAVVALTGLLMQYQNDGVD